MRVRTAPAPAPAGAARSTLLTALAAGAAAAVMAGCASGPDATWSDPSVAGQKPLQGARVLVVCEAVDTTLQQLCLDRMSEELTARGLSPLRSDAGGSAVGRGPESYMAAARAAGASALLLTSVAPDSARVVAPAPPVSIGIGGFSFGGRGGVGVGVGVPIGGGGGGYYDAGYAANSSFTDATSGRLLWSARTNTSTSNLNSGMGDMARTLMGAAEKAGVF